MTDKAGRPIAKAAIRPFKFLDSTLMRLHEFGETDANGVWTWDWAPDQELDYSVSKTGYVGNHRAALRPRPEPYEFTLQPELYAKVIVVDDATGRPVPAFRVTALFVPVKDGKAGQVARPLQSQAVASPDGEYTIRQASVPFDMYALRIEAPGYAPAKSRNIRADEENVTIDFRLIAARPREAVALNPDGTPAAGAAVLVGTQANRVDLFSSFNNRPVRSSPSPAVRTDGEGRFHIDAQADDFTIFVVATSGFARVRRAEFEKIADEPVKIVLKPWARLEGTLRYRQKLLPKASVSLRFAEERPGSPSFSSHTADFLHETVTDTNGRFIFDRIPPETSMEVCNTATWCRTRFARAPAPASAAAPAWEGVNPRRFKWPPVSFGRSRWERQTGR